jgi:hypothetical protein
MKKKHLKKVKKALNKQGLLWPEEIKDILNMLKGK